MKRFTFHLLFALFTFCVGVVAPAGYSFFQCDSGPVTKNWRTYTNQEYGYRLRYPESWKLRAWSAEVYLCSPRIKFPCGRTPHEVYASVGVSIGDPEGLTLAEYLRSPARGYKNLRKLQVGGIQALATGPVNDDFGRFIDEQVYLLHGGKIYSITAYAVDGCPKEFERVLSTFEFTK